ncbi:MAG: hypothetical protein ACRDXX_01780 [Stackebrandtia sp.]
MPAEPDDRDDPSHRRAHQDDLADAKETLERVRREMPYRKALWGFRLHYIGLFSSLGSLLLSCVDESDGPMYVIPIALPLGIAGYVYGLMRVRDELRAYMAAANPEVWHSRRDRKNEWQSAVFRDAFMGRLR